MTQANPQAVQRQVHIDTIQTLFADAPTLRDVAQNSAQAYLDELFAPRKLAAEHLHVRTPLTGQATSYAYLPLAEAVVARLVNHAPTLYVPGHHEVMQKNGDSYEPSELTIFECEALVNERGVLLLMSYQEQVQARWQTRWQPLVYALMDIVSTTPEQPGMSRNSRNTFCSLYFTNPSGGLSAPSGPLQVSTVHVRREGAAADDSGETLPLWLLTAPSSNAMALYSPASGVQLLDSLEDIAPLLADHLSPASQAPVAQWFVCDYPGLAPEALASCYCARQLSEIAAINPAVRRTAEQYQTLLNAITDTRRWFVSPLTAFGQSVHEAMPAWLFNAPQADRMQCARLLAEQVRQLNEATGKRFFPEIPCLVKFAETALQACLDSESRAAQLKVGDIQLVFGLPHAEPVTLSLVEWALDTLGGFADVPRAIMLNSEPAPAWLNWHVLGGWRVKADIATAFGAMLRQQFAKREGQKDWDLGVACDHMLSQLKMLALTCKIQGLHGLTQHGYRMISDRAGGLRGSARLLPLMLKGTETGQTATVQNMYVLLPREAQPGSCLLYRPLMHPVLQEFASTADLLAAIKAPGTLRDSLVAWLSAGRRSTFTPLLSSASEAELTLDVSEDVEEVQSLREAFYLVLDTLGDWPESGGDALHWATFKPGDWSLPNSLMPLVQGVDTLSGWFGLLRANLQGRPTSVDVLGNLAWALAHRASPTNVQLQLDMASLMFATPQLARALPKMTQIPVPETFTQPAKWGTVHSVEAAARYGRQQARSNIEKLQALYDGADRDRAEAQTREAVIAQVWGKQVDTPTEAQSRQVRDTYYQVLQDKLRALSKQLETLKTMRAQVPRLGYEAQVCGLLKALVPTARTLGNLAERVIAASDAHRVSLPDTQFASMLEDKHERLAAFKSIITWREEETLYLDELKALIGCGAEAANALTLTVARPSLLALRAQHLRRLWRAAWDANTTGGAAMFARLLSNTLQRAGYASQSHADCTDLLPAERIEVLESALQVYGESLDQLEFCRAMTPQAFDLGYLPELQALIGVLHEMAEKHLVEALAHPVPVTVDAGVPVNSLLRTRNGDVYKARVFDGTYDQPARLAELRDVSDELIGSFRQAADGLWEPLEPLEATAAPSCPTSDTLLERVEQGKLTLADVERMLEKAQMMVPTAKCAHSLQVALGVPAAYLLTCAEAMRRKLASVVNDRWPVTRRLTAQRIEADWRAAAARLYEQGARVSIAVIRAQAPAQSGTGALLTTHEVRLLKQSGRFRLEDSADQYVQVYPMLDVHSGQMSGYIHLRYGHAAGREDLFTDAYVKTPEQHQAIRQTVPPLSFKRWTLPDAASVLARHRSHISRQLACRWIAEAGVLLS